MFITVTAISWSTAKKTYLNKIFKIKKRTIERMCDFFMWLGYLGSNQGMSESEADALPLGYTPIIPLNGLQQHPGLLLAR